MHNTRRPPDRRVLVVRPGALGDALLTFPALAMLRQAWPDAHITFVSRADVLPFAAASGLADSTSDFASALWSALFLPTNTLGQNMDALRDMLTGTRYALAWLSDDEGTVATNLRAAGIATVAVAPGRPSPDVAEHAAKQVASALALLGIAPPASDSDYPDDVLALATTAADQERAGKVWHDLGLRPDATGVVALHAGSGGSSKRWPPTGFASVASGLAASGYLPVLVEGPQDGALAAHIKRILRESGVLTSLPVVRDVSVSTLAEVLRRCAAYVGNDSGVSHLAGLVGIPTLALFGPTDPRLWRPLGRHVFVLRSPTDRLTDVAAADVLSALLGLLGHSS